MLTRTRSWGPGWGRRLFEDVCAMECDSAGERRFTIPQLIGVGRAIDQPPGRRVSALDKKVGLLLLRGAGHASCIYSFSDVGSDDE
ncbi:hypothetical protein ALQ95_101838 [Pseudomonas syringae pv. ribicola]|uniref:Uncharacterized protein n=1 Tax=Pseudomonas syringae pv. ribicola TaxID=55398 RepID=A0A3M2VLL6_PSESI|nr:hypothetical protein ALQ95_101838 [Pseudomonas syringae pv. ribicola]